MLIQIQILLLLLWAPFNAVADNTDNDDIQQIIKSHEEIQKQMAPLNALNPMSDQKLDVAPSTQTGALANIQQLLSNKWVQKYLKLLSDKDVVDQIQYITQHSNRNLLLYIEIAFGFIIFIFRTWRLHKATTFLRRLWVRFYVFVLFILIGSFVIPHFIIGPTYMTLLKRIYAVWTS